MEKQTNKAFGITENKGFHLTFKNGLTLSVQFGYGSYCENKGKEDLKLFNKPARSDNCEIAVFRKGENGFCTKEFGFKEDVEGWLGIDDVVKLINRVSRFKKKK